MPTVNGKKYPYTTAGKLAAKKAGAKKPGAKKAGTAKKKQKTWSWIYSG